MLRASTTLLFVLTVAISAVSTSAQAQDCSGLGYAFLYGYGGFGNVGMRAYSPAPPYFALHPPVYYGARYTRPYGVSPFAAWPQMQPNPSYQPQPAASYTQTINNPYAPAVVPAAATGTAPIVQLQPVEPKVIENPYFQPEAAQYVKQAIAQ